MNSNVNDRLKDAREYLGLTIEIVSNFLDISIEKLMSIENGQERPDIDEIHMLSKLYKHPESYFLEGVYSENEDVELLARASDDLSEKDRESILRFSKILSEMK
ncbi:MULTISPECIES: helix-turn-helix domain-containing protein [Lysinibacillus]|uniref:Helix-turn-helix transcriptional regulator n=1 Tax=Lysinibacillus capsici TaxID=2115968 RepID=A0ABY8KJM5_9BACI|nr:helix-turn-helix transcriptional regulator [Lysinibacillus capsici]MCT1538518.1 helix-turn-helix domain-containing protein [Lysinibacillus capsici]MCT1569226.1 helix-turn-helix domain-containing protein [Lysinibacillus capsici]MCT1646241.1 helix-turn-helix domain-containing protein [Lysinibacillus capsici]MCT1725253.1 helix-turn-helix domain-containing protein [Lysinibacillus capsici]MCT1784033.1 helix-turn-helix domain-containing protein [Lysinibacillus capsici]